VKKRTLLTFRRMDLKPDHGGGRSIARPGGRWQDFLCAWSTQVFASLGLDSRVRHAQSASGRLHFCRLAEHSGMGDRAGGRNQYWIVFGVAMVVFSLTTRNTQL
jgi:hypothetical protein